MPKKKDPKDPYNVWGGRFTGRPAALMEAFNQSLSVDRRLADVDIRGSMAYARALQRARVLTAAEVRRIVRGLELVARELRRGKFAFSSHDEDIHMAIERRLTEKIGAVAQKLPTGRSRNDQVATDVRLYLKDALAHLRAEAALLQAALLDVAEREMETVLPGYTHLQQAQPVLLSHYLLSLAWALERDKARLADCGARADCLPLGSGALAGNPYPIDYRALAKDLGFARVAENSIDAVSDRDALLECVTACATLMIHLSRYAEDLILWSSQEFRFVEMDDAVATGSSLMPQKKNPDALELIRGKTARAVGNVTTLATLLKGVPLAYCKDLQEDKAPLFDSIDTTLASLRVFTLVVRTLRVDAARMAAAIDPAVLATELADYLVRKGVPFRKSHHVAGRVVRYARQTGKRLDALTVAELRKFSPRFDTDVAAALDVRHAVARRRGPSGTAPTSVRRQLRRLRSRLARETY